jgi:hypothetical protein
MLRVLSTWNGFVGSPGYTNLYWRPGTGGGSVADATDCVARVRALWVALAPQVSTSVSIAVNNLVEAVEDTTGALVGAFTGASVASVFGSGGTALAARGSAWVMQEKTALIVGRRFLRGHIFLAPLVQASFGADGNPTGFAATNAAGTAMLTGGGTASFPVVWARPTTTPAVRAGTSGAVTSFQVSTKAGVLRSRRD